MRPGVHGLMAEFETPEALLAAATSAYERGYRRMDAYSPFPIDGLDRAIGFASSKLPILVFIGGVVGALGGYFLQYFASVIDYPLNIGGRPFHSWPSFIPVTFECAVLGAALTAVLGMFALNGLPKPYHPVFNVERFQFASKDRFFLCIEATDPIYDRQKTERDLAGWKAREVSEVPE